METPFCAWSFGTLSLPPPHSEGAEVPAGGRSQVIVLTCLVRVPGPLGHYFSSTISSSSVRGKICNKSSRVAYHISFKRAAPAPAATPEVCETALLIKWKPLPSALTDGVAFQEALQGMDNPMFRLGEGTRGSGQGAERLTPKLIHRRTIYLIPLPSDP